MIAVLHRRVPPLLAALIGLTLLTSLVAAIDHHRGGDLYYRLALVPEDVWRGELWRLVTWPFVHTGPRGLVVGLIELWWFAGALLGAWSTRRTLGFVALIVLAAGVGTSLLALVLPRARWIPQFAGLALGNALAIAYGLQFPAARIRLYGLLVITGEVLAYGTAGITVLFAIYYGPSWLLPELIAVLTALVYMSRPRFDWLRRLRARRARSKLGVIRGDRHGGPYYPN